MTGAYEVLNGRHELRLFGRRSLRRDDNIQMDLKETG
jgi:hypothetical protein